MTLQNNFEKEIDGLLDLTLHAKMLRLISIITKRFKGTDIKPIIVGGLSVEVYTKNHYTTHDIDIITPGRQEIGEFLTNDLGFKKLGRSWYNERLELSIEIPSNHLEGSDEKVMELHLPGGGEVYIIGLEDIIIHRLESAIVNHRDNPEWSEDYEWAKRMFEIHKSDERMVDREYLKHASSSEEVVSIIKGWLDTEAHY